MAENKNLSIQEITRREISRINADEKANKFKKDNNRYKKIIAGYKENEKKLLRYIAAINQKMETMKENSIGSLFSLVENIADIKSSFMEYCNSISDEIQGQTFMTFSKEFDYISDFIINVCNAIERSSTVSPDEKLDINPNKLKFAQKANDFDDFEEEGNDDEYSWDFKASTKQNIADNQIAKDKINKLFYETPAVQNDTQNENQNNVSFGLTKNYSGLFDFNEAMNPTMSLNDIMADLNSDNNSSNLVSSTELGDSGDDENEQNNNYDEWFTSLQNLIKKETK